MTKYSQREREEALERLREWIKPGDTVYTVLRHRSSSGMQRTIGLVLIKPADQPGGEPVIFHPNWAVGAVLGLRQDKDRDGIKIGGCGMDMGFHIVFSLSRVLFPDSFDCLGQNCPSNDHFNGDKNREPHRHSDGGYALRHRWL